VLRRKSDKSLTVLAVRVEPMIEQRLRLLADSTGHSQSFFINQMIEENIEAMEAMWLPDELAGRIRAGDLPEQLHGKTPDLFGDPFARDLLGDPIRREDRRAATD
jgi:RHH-type transcriptional regulator, rel operon repressor / antitoxin RelB